MDPRPGTTSLAHALLLVGSLWLQGIHTAVVSCTSGQVIGEPSPSDYTTEVGTNTGLAHLFIDASTKVPCCGLVSAWLFYAKIPGDINGHVWRRNGGNVYKLLSETAITGVAAETNVLYGLSTKPSVAVDDLIGWSVPAGQAEIVSYVTAAWATQGVYSLATTPTEGADTVWAVTADNSKQYAFGARLEPSTAPTFSNLPNTSPATAYTADGAGTSVYTVSYSDADPDDAADLTLSLATTSDYFELSGDVVQVKVSPTVGTHYVDIAVTDLCGQSTTERLTVTVTDGQVVITSLPMSASIREDETTAIVLLHDLIFTDDGPLTDVNCSMVTNPTPAPFLFRYKDNSADDAIFFEKSEEHPLNYDITQLYYCSITCNDGTSDSETKVFQVSIIPNDDPVFAPPTEIVVSADTTENGTQVFSAADYVTDTDGGDLEYSMSCTCPFKMYRNGHMHATESLNSHRDSPYVVTMNVSDGYNVVQKTMTITINELNSPPNITKPQVAPPGYDQTYVNENTGAGFLVYTAVGTDDIDAITDTITWSVKWDPTRGDEYFTFDSTSGEIRTVVDLDFEDICDEFASLTFGVDIQAFDGREYSDETRHLDIIVINENEAPTFTNTDYAIGTGEGSASTTLDCPLFDATDPDSSCSNDALDYTIDCGTPGMFHVTSPGVGCAALIQMTQEYDLDPTGPEEEVVTCTVTVTDEGGLTDTATLKITVWEIDDNWPLFKDRSYVYTISNNTGMGSFFASCDTTDDDYLAEHQQNIYTTDHSAFGIGESCKLFTKIDFRTVMAPQTYTFRATAVDRAGHTDVATITVNVIDIPPTTTTTTTTPAIPDMYDYIGNFFDDTGNIIWFTVAMILSALALGLLTYAIYRCCTTPGACGCFRDCCMGDRHHGSRRRVEQAPQNNRAIEDSKPRPEKKKSSICDCFKRQNEPARPEGHRMWEGWKGEDFRSANQGYS